MLEENIVEKGGIAQNEQFHLFNYVFYTICILKSFHTHISVAVCSLIIWIWDGLKMVY